MSKSKMIQEKKANALEMMKQAGFEIKQPVEIVVDENLPFMGYTSERWNQHVIVVSGMAVESGMLEGLLIHEMSHIYRTETNHPSHNHRLLNEISKDVLSKFQISRKYQLQILQQIVNHVQDLYADDISFKVFQKNRDKLFPTDLMSSFFQSWIRPEPAELKNKKQEKWVNAAIMLNNAFAISNMERHHVEDLQNKAGITNRKFLSRLNGPLAVKFSYFKAHMTNLKENVGEDEFKTSLMDYLNNFMKLVT